MRLPCFRILPSHSAVALAATAILLGFGAPESRCCAGPQATRQSTLRKLPLKGAAKGEIRLPEYTDTIPCGEGDIVLRGFHKPLRSRRESVFATNNTPNDVAALILDITYTDTKGRTLHRQKRTVALDLPKGETRRLDFPSWDRQQVFYYSRSPEPPRADGTPFDVRCRVESLIINTGIINADIGRDTFPTLDPECLPVSADEADIE